MKNSLPLFKQQEQMQECHLSFVRSILRVELISARFNLRSNDSRFQCGPDYHSPNITSSNTFVKVHTYTYLLLNENGQDFS
jgi:hypothetical protein